MGRSPDVAGHRPVARVCHRRVACLPRLLVGVGVAAWNQRGNGAWPWLIGLCVPPAFVGMAIVQFWPHGALLAVAPACSFLTWATRAPASDSFVTLPQPSQPPTLMVVRLAPTKPRLRQCSGMSHESNMLQRACGGGLSLHRQDGEM